MNALKKIFKNRDPLSEEERMMIIEKSSKQVVVVL